MHQLGPRSTRHYHDTVHLNGEKSISMLVVVVVIVVSLLCHVVGIARVYPWDFVWYLSPTVGNEWHHGQHCWVV